MKAFILISVLCVCWALAAKPEKRHVSQEGKKQENRILYDSGIKTNNLWSSSPDFGFGQGYAQKVITKIVEKKIPVPYTVEKHVPYTVEKKVPYEVKVPVPQPYTVEKKVPYPVKEIVRVPYYVPRPYEVIKRVPYQVVVPVPKPYEVNVTILKPYTVEKRVPYPVRVPIPEPYTVEKKVPYEVKYEVPVPQPYIVEKKIPYEVKVPVYKPYTVHVPKPYSVTVEKHVRVPVEKRVPYEVKVQVDKLYPVEVLKPVPYNVNVLVPSPYTVEKKVQVEVERPVAVPVEVPVDKPYPVYKEVPVVLQQEVPYTVKVPVHIQLSSGGNQWQENNEVNNNGDQYQQKQSNSGDKINHETQHNSNEITQTHQSDSDAAQNHQQLDLAQLQHQLTSDYRDEKQTSQHQYTQYNYGNTADKGQQQLNGKVKLGQWQQLAGNGKPEQEFYLNANFDFALPEQNIENYKTENSNKAIGKEQNVNGISTKLNDSYGEQLQSQNGHEHTYQSQNNLKGFTQLKPDNGHDLSSQINHEAISNQRPQEYNNDHQNQWQKQRGNALEHQGYTYDAPVKSTSLQVESGNAQHHQISYGEPAQQQLIYLDSKTNEKPQQQQYTNFETYANHVQSGNNQHQSYEEVAHQQLINTGLKINENTQQLQQYTSCETHVNHETVKPEQPQIDYANYVQHQSTYLKEADGKHQVNYGSEKSNYTAHAQAVGNAGSYEDNQNSYKALEEQHPTYEYTHHTGSSGHQDVGQGVTYGYEINGQEQTKRQEQPTYTSGYSSDNAAGNGLVYRHETVGQEQQEQQSKYAHRSSNNQDIGNIVSYKHDTIGQGKHSYKSQGVQNPKGESSGQGYQSFKTYPAYTTGSKEQGVSYDYEMVGQERAGEKQNIYGVHIESSNQHSRPSSHESTVKPSHQVIDQNQQISSAKYESFIQPPDHGQFFENYAGSSLVRQPQQSNEDKSFDQAQQVTYGSVEQSGYGTEVSSASKQGQQNQDWK